MVEKERAAAMVGAAARRIFWAGTAFAGCLKSDAATALRIKKNMVTIPVKPREIMTD